MGSQKNQRWLISEPEKRCPEQIRLSSDRTRRDLSDDNLISPGRCFFVAEELDTCPKMEKIWFFENTQNLGFQTIWRPF